MKGGDEAKVAGPYNKPEYLLPQSDRRSPPVGSRRTPTTLLVWT